MINLENIVWKEGVYYVAQCLNVDVSSFGETKEEALSNLNEALELYFEDNDKGGFQEIEQPEIIHTTFSYA
jgi:predicted RNase H-like HicB family nuclease